MATRSMRKKGQADWRAAFRRSMRRAAQMAGAGGLLILLVFLTLAMASYTQTDPSGSTAASGNDIRNWMGASGAWAADKVLGTFGITSMLLLPLIYIGARKLWQGIEHEDEEDTTRWW
ncbi:MAG: DNA translocase FtsK 4TM domain-containing protein, partial [Altererythrobacter ishigakiensis]|nr:DNA translocase FtsK 4TM domain-containing protein [Altererythrobacter ishigakiensis]